jgi:type IV pilus assembly protein PilN
MRVPINLASQPFRRDRPMLIATGACAVALLGLLGVLIFLIMGERASASDSRIAVQKLNNQLRGINAEQAKLDATLRQPANAQVLERSLLLNTLVQRKAISWTKIFADLESVMPMNVRLIQVRLPQITSHSEVVLDMTVGSQEPTPVIDFLKRLQASPLFGPVTMHSSAPPTQNQPLYQFRLSVNYAQKL